MIGWLTWNFPIDAPHVVAYPQYSNLNLDRVSQLHGSAVSEICNLCRASSALMRHVVLVSGLCSQKLSTWLPRFLSGSGLCECALVTSWAI
jgi:hypothetical protein